MTIRIKDRFSLNMCPLHTLQPYELVKMPEKYRETFHAMPDVVRNVVWRTGIGIENEVEQSAPISTIWWQCDKDGSLRNDGMEFKTSYGLRFCDSFDALIDLKQRMDEFTPDHEYSERCSVHWHVDVRYMTDDQLENLCVLYTIFEKMLFAISSQTRENNIFCVPLRSSSLTHVFSGNIFDHVERAEKYCAFNLKTIPQFGTVEFRHHEGTDDPERLWLWGTICVLLVTAAKMFDTKELREEVSRLKYESQYERFLDRVFYGFKALLPYVPQDLDVAVSDAKLFFAGRT